MGAVEVFHSTARVVAGSAGEIGVVHAYPVGLEAGRDFRDPTRNAWLRRFQEEADARIGEFADEMRSFGISVRAVARPGRPEEVVRREATAATADLVAVGTHAAQGIARWLAGSVARDVVRRASCDVLVSRPSHPSRAFPPRVALRGADADRE
jgi:nucleotide-binding universal stress UspA family protein